MTKYLSALLFGIIVFTTHLIAQDATFEQGQSNVHVGVGIGGGYLYGLGGGAPSVHVTYEYGMTDNISVGGFAGFASSKWTYFGVGYKQRHLIFAGKGAYHHSFTDKLDTYAGLMLGFQIVSLKGVGGTMPPGQDSAGWFAFSTFAGANYMFTDNLGAFAEIGYGVAILSVGLNLQLGG